MTSGSLTAVFAIIYQVRMMRVYEQLINPHSVFCIPALPERSTMMDLEKTILLEEKNEATVIELDPEFTAVICDYVKLNHHVLEINQLFALFRFNMERLYQSYTIQRDDRVIRKDGFYTGYTDFIAINALVINLISAGRSLVDSLDICMKHSYGEESEAYKSFAAECKCRIYDKSFAYRFFYELRNFSQHIHVPVSMNGNRCCFDINQILNTPHYKAKETLKKEWKALEKEIREKRRDTFRLSFSHILMQYIASVAELHRGFWVHIKDQLFALNQLVSDTAHANPEILNHNHPKFDGYILYKAPERGEWQLVSPNADTGAYYSNCLREAEDFYAETSRDYQEFEKHCEPCL